MRRSGQLEEQHICLATVHVALIDQVHSADGETRGHIVFSLKQMAK